jgi:hypothetical protein
MFVKEKEYLNLFKYFEKNEIKKLKTICKIWYLYLSDEKTWEYFSLKRWKLEDIQDKSSIKWIDYYNLRDELEESMDESNF